MTDEKAPTAGQGGEGKDQSPTTYEGEPIMTIIADAADICTDYRAAIERDQRRQVAYLERHRVELEAAQPSWAETVWVDAVDFQEEADIWYGTERGVVSIATVVEHSPAGFTDPSSLERLALSIHWEDSGEKTADEALVEVRSILADLTAIEGVLAAIVRGDSQ